MSGVYQNFRNSNYTLSEGNKAQVTFNVATDGAVDPWTYPAEPNLQHLGGTREGKPIVKLVPARPAKSRGYGAWKGKFTLPDSFFDPLPEDELDAWEGKYGSDP